MRQPSHVTATQSNPVNQIKVNQTKSNQIKPVGVVECPEIGHAIPVLRSHDSVVY